MKEPLSGANYEQLGNLVQLSVVWAKSACLIRLLSVVSTGDGCISTSLLFKPTYAMTL